MVGKAGGGDALRVISRVDGRVHGGPARRRVLDPPGLKLTVGPRRPVGELRLYASDRDYLRGGR